MNLFLKEGIWWVELQERDFVRRRSAFETNKNRAREVARMLWATSPHRRRTEGH
jgi:hypothetical protein